jgi:hypothetical protein
VRSNQAIAGPTAGKVAPESIIRTSAAHVFSRYSNCRSDSRDCSVTSRASPTSLSKLSLSFVIGESETWVPVGTRHMPLQEICEYLFFQNSQSQRVFVLEKLIVF